MAANGEERRGPNAGQSALVVRPPQTGAISFVNFAPQPPYDERLIFWEGRNLDTAAAFRLLRQRLIDRGDPRTMLCTSAMRGEGKTTLATNLALAFAELGKYRVLLIETSFRSAAVGRGVRIQASHRLREPARPPSPSPRRALGRRADRGLAALRPGGRARCCPKCAGGARRGSEVLRHVRNGGERRRGWPDRRDDLRRGDRKISGSPSTTWCSTPRPSSPAATST